MHRGGSFTEMSQQPLNEAQLHEELLIARFKSLNIGGPVAREDSSSFPGPAQLAHYSCRAI